jgi:hypothetical protein
MTWSVDTIFMLVLVGRSLRFEWRGDCGSLWELGLMTEAKVRCCDAVDVCRVASLFARSSAVAWNPLDQVKTSQLRGSSIRYWNAAGYLASAVGSGMHLTIINVLRSLLMQSLLYNPVSTDDDSMFGQHSQNLGAVKIGKLPENKSFPL